MKPELQQIVQDFLSCLNMPKHRVFILGIIGNIGSGKTMIAQMLAEKLLGAVVVSADSARYLLKEQGLRWGDNVRTVVRSVAEELLKRGHAVILDGSNADEEERRQTAELAAHRNVLVRYIRILADPETCRDRVNKKYADPNWQSSFRHMRFRINPASPEGNLAERTKLHEALKDKDIAGLVGTVDNNGTIDQLRPKITLLAKKILQSL